MNIVNSCNFLLSKLEDMKSGRFCMKAANNWVRLYGCRHHLLVVLVVEKNIPFTSKRVCKLQFMSKICNHDPILTLIFVGLRVDNSESVTIKSLN